MSVSISRVFGSSRLWFPPPLRGRDREGGDCDAVNLSTTPLSTSPPHGRREPGRATASQSLKNRKFRPASILFLALTLAILTSGLTLIGQGVYIHAKAILAQVLLDRAFAQSLATGKTIKPWSWADTWPVARIELPRLRESAIVLAGSSGQALAFGPGHVEQTPAAGEPGTAIYAAHRDTHFSFLGRVKVGDEIRVTRRDGVRITFRVTRTAIAPWDAPGIDPYASGRHLVLSTCWPLDAKTDGPLRYLVFAEAV